MILVHRLHGEEMFLNADLIETVEAAPDTIVTLIDGRRIIVQELPEHIVSLVAGFRASVIVAADEQRTTGRPALRAVPSIEA